MGNEVKTAFAIFVAVVGLSLATILWGAAELNLQPAVINRWEGYEGPK